MTGFEVLDISGWAWFRLARQCPLFISLNNVPGALYRVIGKAYEGVTFYHPGFPEGSITLDEKHFLERTPLQDGILNMHTIPVRLS